MYIKGFRFVLNVLLIMMMFFPAMPVAASTPPPQQDKIIAYHPLTGMVRFMGAQSGTPILETTALESNATPEKAALSFLTMRGSEFGIVDAKNDLKVLRKTQTDNDTSTVRFQQTYQGIPILAGEMIVHMDAARNVLSASGDILPNIELDITPVVDEAAAIQNALDATAKESGIHADDLQASTPELWVYNPALLTPYKGETLLTWLIEVTPKTDLAPVRQLVLVEAKRGSIVISFNQVDFSKNRLTYNTFGTNSLPGTLICNESNPNCTGGSDAINAHVYAGHTYDFYMSNHSRDSINGAGMSLISTVNYDDVPGGAAYENAFWSGTQMVYGAGFADADDVVAHELTHGVTEYESNLFYFWQSGAINESFSDVWGEFIDLGNGAGTDTPATRWQMGEDLSIGALRTMSNPTINNDPDKITSTYYYTGNGDNGGVHINSGVNNKAAYLMVDGGTFNGQTITGLGITKVAKIYYYVQSNLLTSGSDYADLYYALQTSCAAQTGTAGITAADCQEVLDAVNAVEMNLQPVAGYNPDIAACSVAGQYPLNSFYDNLEAGSTNWVSGAAIDTNRWSYDSSYYGSYAHSGQHSLYADDFPGTPTDTYLSMANSVTVPPNGKLLFHHAYALETGFDGGMLEYSTNGGSSWTDAGSLMDDNGYDALLSSSSGNPLGGRQAFTGLSHGYISTRLNLNPLTGQNIKFRFRMGLDSNNYALGWWLDDVQIYECKTEPYVLSSVLANTNPTSATSVGFTVTFTESVTGVDVSDFSLTTTGVSGAAVSGFSGSGSSYTVTVNTGVGTGTIRLNVLNDGTIKDTTLNPLGAGFTSGESYTVTKSAIFADVPLDYWANSYIERLYNAGITGGCSVTPLNYCPNSTVTRAQMAIFLLKGIHGSSYVPPLVGASTGFADVAINYWAASWIKQLAAEGVTAGCGSGNYCPDTSVSRAQMAIFLLRAKHGSSYTPPNATGVFMDVPVGYWADKWIEQLAVEGVTSGCGNSNYCPDNPVTRAEMAIFLVKTFSLP